MSKFSVETIEPKLQIEEALHLQEWGWKVQRVGWFLIFLLPVLGAMGLFGEGFISSQKEQKGAIETESERFYRYEKEMQLSIKSLAGHIPQIALPQQYLHNFRIMRIIPEPEHRLAIGQNIVFQFGGNNNRQVTIYAVPQNFGSISGVLAVNNQQFSLQHFIFP